MSKSKKRRSASTWALSVLALSLGLLFLGVVAIAAYKKGYSDAQQDVALEQKAAQEKEKKLSEEAKAPAKEKSDLVGRLQDVLSKEKLESEAKPDLHTTPKPEIDTKHEFDTNTLGRPPKGPTREVRKKAIYSKFDKPKLVIIIDDVSCAGDVKAIKSLNMPLTMSFLPPSRANPDSAKLAEREKFYMVHLPLEAMNYSAEEKFTLRISDSRETIQKRVQEVKSLFPRVRYINNHTGSRFTSDETAVTNLVNVLQDEGIGFLDSRTTAKTKVPMVMKSLGLPYLARDIFLDHESTVPYIEEQIIKAIRKAKEHGSAIAIGHPRKETIQALRNSKKALESVELVYLNTMI